MKLGTIFLDDKLIEKYNIPFKAITFIDDGTNKTKQSEQAIKDLYEGYNVKEEIWYYKTKTRFYEIKDIER